MIDGIPVIDAVVHPYNLTEENFRTPHARPITDIVSAGNRSVAPEGYRLPQEGYERDWSVEEVATMSFVENYTDLASYHVVPIRAFHDGICSIEKGLEAQERWPDRFLFYVGVDPLEGQKAFDDLDRQMEQFRDVTGLKLYPNSWLGQEVAGWKMDDPEVAFPIFEHARRHGIKTVAIHKAIPLGPVELQHYRVDDIDRAAMAFPDLNFEIVHGGMAFLEETAWQITRFRNVWVNLETTATMLTNRPAAFERAFAALIQHGGKKALGQIFWGTGCMVSHPRPHLEHFVRDFTLSAEITDRFGLPEISTDVKRAILAENYARLHGIDLGERLSRIKGDEFDLRRPDGTEPARGYSTTAVGDVAY
ncbi:amidohydrolase family protein [Pseudonocardia dioxanivorans]|uniref:amidohydrolase family protein n=1 Tax=Pseudonocardia dioxanivorans TaxID=240495 RepID=UPI000CD23B39|nr:amidohydrolase family protein [Pseudonocardia dioxanivorans]